MEKEIVSVEWLNNNLYRSDLIILDASPNKTIDGRNSSFDQLSIPNARRFNIKEQFSNKESEFPNTVPSTLQFKQECQKLGINQNSEIVVYDNLGIYTSPRTWWLFKVMGHEKIKVLNGGLPEWFSKGYETSKLSEIKQEYKLGNFECDFRKELVISYDEIITNIESSEFLVIDARSQGRFNGTEEEPRKYLKSGSIPKSVNIPYKLLLENGKFKSIDQIRDIFAQRSISQKQLVFSCGSGITACIVMLASEIGFQKSKYLYDGSWTEFATKSK